MKIDAHHHLWDLNAVSYPWLMETGIRRFFGDPSPIQRDYLLPEFRSDAAAAGMRGSVHIQVGAANGLAEATWVQSIADASPDWPIRQVVFLDLTSKTLEQELDAFARLKSVVGVRQIVGRAPGEDAQTGTNTLLANPAFLDGLRKAQARGYSFDLQLLPELMADAARVFEQVPEMPVALCHAGSPHDRSPAGIAAYETALHYLSVLPNVVCKLSGLGMFDHQWTADSTQPIADICMDQFGPNRLMFGSNFPVDSLSSTYDELISRHQQMTQRLAEPAQANFWGTTAASFYGFA